MLTFCRQQYVAWVNANVTAADRPVWLAEANQHWHDYRLGWRCLMTRAYQGLSTNNSGRRAIFLDWVNRHPNTIAMWGGDDWKAVSSSHWQDCQAGWAAALAEFNSGKTEIELGA